MLNTDLPVRSVEIDAFDYRVIEGTHKLEALRCPTPEGTPAKVNNSGTQRRMIPPRVTLG